MVVTLIRDDMHLYLGAVAMAAAACQQQWDLICICAGAMCLASSAFWVLQRPTASLTKHRVDASMARYFASVLVWCSIAAIAYCIGLCGGFLQDWDIRHNERVVFAASIALGVGVQDTLANFAAGLLLVLFRPFRVGDDITVCDLCFTVESVTAFFTNGSTFSNQHVLIPNSKVIQNIITNWTSNPSIVLELSVHVRFGRQPCSKVRKAMTAAAKDFDAKLLEVVETYPIENPKAVLAKLPSCETNGVYGPMDISSKGTQWMLKPHVPEKAMLRCTDLGYECIHDALMSAGIEVFEECFSGK